MDWHINEDLYKEIIDTEFAAGIFNSNRELVSHSPKFGEYLLSPRHEPFVEHITIQDLFPELVGFEDELDSINAGRKKDLFVERIHRPSLYGKPGYISLRVKAYNNRLLVVIHNTTSSGEMEQQITQQRNALDLLSERLIEAHIRIDQLLRTYVPNAVVDDLIKKNTTRLDGEIREVTILFADLRGYTAWAEQHRPEEALSGLNRLLSDAFEVLNDHGATINQLMGDGFMSIFNAPTDQPGHASLALKSAQELINLPGLDTNVSFGVGVNTGPAMTGNVGSSRAMDYSAIGTTTNIAYRLQQLAGAREALFGGRTLQMADHQFNYIFHGEFEVKGIHLPLPVYKLVD
jgi:class 3 adenylate cyclase